MRQVARIGKERGKEQRKRKLSREKQKGNRDVKRDGKYLKWNHEEKQQFDNKKNIQGIQCNIAVGNIFNLNQICSRDKLGEKNLITWSINSERQRMLCKYIL